MDPIWIKDPTFVVLILIVLSYFITFVVVLGVIGVTVASAVPGPAPFWTSIYGNSMVTLSYLDSFCSIWNRFYQRCFSNNHWLIANCYRICEHLMHVCLNILCRLPLHGSASVWCVLMFNNTSLMLIKTYIYFKG